MGSCDIEEGDERLGSFVKKSPSRVPARQQAKHFNFRWNTPVPPPFTGTASVIAVCTAHTISACIKAVSGMSTGDLDRKCRHRFPILVQEAVPCKEPYRSSEDTNGSNRFCQA